MSSCSSASGPQGGWQSNWKSGCSGTARWRPIEIAAVVLAFAMWWPVGVALVGLKLAQRRGYGFEQAAASVRSAFAGFGPQTAQAGQWRPFSPTSGNAAFDDWRKAEMERLDEERRKLDAAQREFSEHMNNLRRAKDREEFDRFMNERSAKGQ